MHASALVNASLMVVDEIREAEKTSQNSLPKRCVKLKKSQLVSLSMSCILTTGSVETLTWFLSNMDAP